MPQQTMEVPAETYKARITKLQEAMKEFGLRAVVLEPGAAMMYLTGVRWGRSERTFAVVFAVPDFYPSGFLPNGVRLTGYFGDASDLPQAALQDFLDAVAAGEATVPIAKTYTMDETATAHDDMEHDRVAGKLVVSTGR